MTVAALLLAGCTPADRTAEAYACEAPRLEPHPHEARYRRIIDEALALGAPAVSLAVVSPEGGWAGAGGTVDLALDVPAEVCHRYPVASVTKMFSATATLALADRGLVELDEPARSYLPDDITASVPAVADGATVRQLLHHTSGVPDYLGLGFFLDAFDGSLAPASAAESLRRIAGRPARFSPGSDFAYSNANYLLVALILAAVTDRSAWDVVHEQVIDPLDLQTTEGMSETSAAFARGYLDLHDNGVFVDETSMTRAVMSGPDKLDGGLLSTPLDVAAVLRALDRQSLLSADATAEMRAFLDYGPGEDDGIEDGYGLGLARIATPWGPAYGHYGTVHPYQTLAFHFPAHDTTVVLTTNGYSGAISDWMASDAPYAPLFDPEVP